MFRFALFSKGKSFTEFMHVYVGFLFFVFSRRPRIFLIQDPSFKQ